MIKQIQKITVGQEVYAVTTGNRARGGSMILKGIVTKVGKKYFDVDHIGDYGCKMGTFFNDSMKEKTDFSSNYTIYLTEEEAIDVVNKPKAIREVSELLKSLNKKI